MSENNSNSTGTTHQGNSSEKAGHTSDVVAVVEQDAESQGTMNEVTAGLMSSLVPMMLVIAIFYFFIIRPHDKKLKQHKEKVFSVKKSEEVVTSGGIFGTVTKVIDEHTVELQIADKVFVKCLKSSINDIVSRK